MLKPILSLALLSTCIVSSCFAAVPNSPMYTRSGPSAIVYFTRDLSPAGLQKAYARISASITGKTGLKLHTGERNGPNLLPREWVKELQAKIPNSAIIEANAYYYPSDRYTTEAHRETIKNNGWTFCPVDILDEEGATMLPVKNGKQLQQISVGSHLLNYNSLCVLTHFTGDVVAGFGGSNVNLGEGCADGRIGKAMLHTGDNPSEWGLTDKQWQILKEPFMERVTEASKAVVDHFGKNIAYINVLRKMSSSCDCEGFHAAPVKAPDLGILASTNLLAIEQASLDMIYALPEAQRKDIAQRIESRAGLHQLIAMKALGLGLDKYTIVDIDKEEAEAKAKAEAEAKLGKNKTNALPNAKAAASPAINNSQPTKTATTPKISPANKLQTTPIAPKAITK